MHTHTFKQRQPMYSEKVTEVAECKLCGKNGEGLTLVSADHKDLGRIMVCEKCWKKLWNENRMVCSTSGSGSTCTSCR